MLKLIKFPSIDIKATFVDIYIGSQQIVGNIPIKQLNIKLLTKNEKGEIIGEFLVSQLPDFMEPPDKLLEEGPTQDENTNNSAGG
jgi:hypothetical protein